MIMLIIILIIVIMIKINFKYIVNMMILDITYDNNSHGTIIVGLRNNSGCQGET